MLVYMSLFNGASIVVRQHYAFQATLVHLADVPTKLLSVPKGFAASTFTERFRLRALLAVFVVDPGGFACSTAANNKRMWQVLVLVDILTFVHYLHHAFHVVFSLA